MRISATVPLWRFLLACCIGAGLVAIHATGTAALDAAEQPEVVNIWPGAAPGTEDWNFPEYIGKNSVTNVTVPTLTVYRPPAIEANGTAVIVAPGGAFQGLAIKVETEPTVQWLTARGITAFALKYRVRVNAAAQPQAGEDFDERAQALEAGRAIAVADGLQAMRYLRANAAKFNIDPDRIGMMGYSAGAMLTMGVVMEGEAGERPDFAASIYGAMQGDSPPSDGPPLFIVHAQDDRAVPVEESINIYSNWIAAGLPVELHIFEQGGHGFGANLRDQPTDLWLSAFDAWLRLHNWTENNPSDRK